MILMFTWKPGVFLKDKSTYNNIHSPNRFHPFIVGPVSIWLYCCDVLITKVVKKIKHMNKLLITLISFSALLLSCSKSETNIYTDKVQVRIQNATGFTLENAKVADINYG